MLCSTPRSFSGQCKYQHCICVIEFGLGCGEEGSQTLGMQKMETYKTNQKSKAGRVEKNMHGKILEYKIAFLKP
jgi:hypothetical protein